MPFTHLLKIVLQFAVFGLSSLNLIDKCNVKIYLESNILQVDRSQKILSKIIEIAIACAAVLALTLKFAVGAARYAVSSRRKN